MLTDLTFTSADGQYSTVIEADGSVQQVVLHLDFPDEPGNEVRIDQSLTGNTWCNAFAQSFGVPNPFVTTLSGLVKGMKIRVQTRLMPTVAKLEDGK